MWNTYFPKLNNYTLKLNIECNEHVYLFQWLAIITCAVLYNLVFVIGRAVFWEMENLLPVGWFVLDYTCDILYLLDTFIRMHEGIDISIYPY